MSWVTNLHENTEFMNCCVENFYLKNWRRNCSNTALWFQYRFLFQLIETMLLSQNLNMHLTVSIPIQNRLSRTKHTDKTQAGLTSRNLINLFPLHFRFTEFLNFYFQFELISPNMRYKISARQICFLFSNQWSITNSIDYRQL